MKAVRVVIDGRVQRVGFRAWTVEQAGLRGLRGWVRNRTDGTVEALFAGAPDAVDKVLEVCRDGPEWAQVSTVRQELADADEVPAGFEQRPTA
ncbi:MAG: acylphosphatase [Acetobacterales bacterium]